MKGYKAIVAMSLNRVIGANNQLPWHLPEELRFFKKMTTGNTIVMGRKTYESIGRPLPNRLTVVLTRNSEKFQSQEGMIVLSSLDQLPSITPRGDIFICGGGELYKQALPFCSELYVTIVKREVAGNVIFPAFEHEFVLNNVLENNDIFTVHHYVRKDVI